MQSTTSWLALGALLVAPLLQAPHVRTPRPQIQKPRDLSGAPVQLTTADREPAPHGALELTLTPAVPTDTVRLSWSPKGAQLPLERLPRSVSRKDALRTTLELGGDGVHLRPRELVLIPSEEAGGPMRLRITVGPDQGTITGVPPERIILDTPPSDEELLSIEPQVIMLEALPSESRGKTWYTWEYTPLLNDQAVQVNVAPGEPSAKVRAGVRAYPISLWFVDDPSASPDAEPVLRWSRRGWHEAHFEWKGQHAALLVCDMQMDGLFDANDAWSMELLGPLDPQGADVEEAAPTDAPWQTRATSRPMSRHVWLGEEAFRLIHITPHGTSIQLEPFDPGITRAEEAALDDAYAADRRAARAEAPLAFGHDFEAAEALAKREGRPLFVDFETTWCGPCKQMDALVYPAQAVVDAAAAANVVAVKVDGDERPDLVELFGVGAYPTLVLVEFDETDKPVEKARRVGYQSVAEMTTFLAELMNRE